MPVVTIDYLTRFIGLLPNLEQTLGMSYWVLDDDTHPQSLTRAHPETLNFLSSDRYPTGPATELARSQGLRHPDVSTSLKRWSDYLEKKGAQ